MPRIYYTFDVSVANTTLTVPTGRKCAVTVWHFRNANPSPLTLRASWYSSAGVLMWQDTAMVSANDSANLTDGELILMPGDTLRVTLGAVPASPIRVTGSYALDNRLG